MNKISCSICCELIPLVKDGVASQESIGVVKEHIATCDSCNAEYNSFPNSYSIKELATHDSIIKCKIKKYLFITALIIIVVGMLVGVGLSESMGMFYNILILPAIGALGFFTLKKKSWLIPTSLFAVVYIWHVVKYLLGEMADYSNISSIFIAPLYWAALYSFLCSVGVAIGFLLYISFRKEKHNKNGDESNEKMG